MNIIDKAISLLKDGAKRVDFEWEGNNVVAYWAGTVLGKSSKKGGKQNG